MGHNSVSGGQSSRGSHLDFTNYWADKTVEEAIFQGQQLRLQKSHPVPSREYDVVNIDFIKPPRSATSSRRRRKKSVKVSTKRHRSKSPHHMPKRRKGRKSQPSCGLRIAELSMPTKRYCLETWKDNYNNLPEHMIERLRQHVLDQQPVVHISDAINCFKRKCPRLKQNKNNKSTDKAVKRIKSPLRKNDCKVLSAIFGHKIAKKLIIPRNITLNTDLEKIANVISYDIGSLMKKARNIDTKNKKYKLIEKDTVNKVTAWIWGVLEETSEKILEDQLKDFEEEAGPVLDFIDDLVDNVLDICLPVPEQCEESYASETDEPSIRESIDSEEINIENYFRNEIDNIINNIDGENDDIHINIEDHFRKEIDDLIEHIDEENDDIHINIEEYFRKEIDNLIEYNDGESDNLESDNIDDGNDYVEAKEFNTNDEANREHVENEETIDINAKDSEDLQLEEQTVNSEINAERDKKNDGEDDAYDDITDNFVDATNENPPLPEGMERKVTFDYGGQEAGWKASIENIDFADPNEDLLSDADESWPEDVHTPVLRPSQSVSKSISSLGQINEVEESASILPDDYDSIDKKKSRSIDATPNLENQTKSVSNDEKQSKSGSIKSKDETVSKGSGKRDSKTANKKIPESPKVKPPTKKSSKPKVSSPRQRSPSKPSKIEGPPTPTKPITKLPKKPKEKHIKPKSKDSVSTKTDQSTKDLENDHKIKVKPSIVKPDYRVNIQTAPTWINRNFKESSCSCFQIPSKPKVKSKVNQNLIKTWCKDLERGYENLKMWNQWVDNTAKTVRALQKEMDKSFCSERCSNKEWVKLKRNIDKDAHLWTNLSKNTQHRLKSYKNMYTKRSDNKIGNFICCSKIK